MCFPLAQHIGRSINLLINEFEVIYVRKDSLHQCTISECCKEDNNEENCNNLLIDS